MADEKGATVSRMSNATLDVTSSRSGFGLEAKKRSQIVISNHLCFKLSLTHSLSYHWGPAQLKGRTASDKQSC